VVRFIRMTGEALTDARIAELLAMRKHQMSTTAAKTRAKAQHEERDYNLQGDGGELFVV